MIKVVVTFFQYKCCEIQLWIENGQWHAGVYIDSEWFTFNGRYDEVLDKVFHMVDMDQQRYIHS